MPRVAGDAAIFWEPDGYRTVGRNIMGRHSAGRAYLQAAVAANCGGDLWAYAAHQRSAEAFASDVRTIDNSVTPRWCARHRLDQLEGIGALYYPGPDIEEMARLRLRRRADAYSLCGVTHTTASHRAMDALSKTIVQPLMPWDAIICTSRAVLETARMAREAEVEQLRWRFGAGVTIPEGPQLPVIPLGIHCDEYFIDEAERARARAELGIAADEVVALFVGRLSFHAKAHPDAMAQALEALAVEKGRKLALIQCGWWSNDAAENAYRSGMADAAPHVRALWTDGREPAEQRRSWAAADLFISLSDNLQETFGLTPLEAMAAGLPVVVSDWDGYKDTVRDGEDGYRIRTALPRPGTGTMLAERYEAGTISYDQYCGFACMLVPVDLAQLKARLAVLVDDAAKRRAMGAAARARVRAAYDWSVVYGLYRELWAELGAIRGAARAFTSVRAALEAAPRVAAGRGDPMRYFGHYASAQIGPDTPVARAERPDGLDYERLREHPLFSFAKQVLTEPAVAEAVRAAAATPTNVASLARRIGKSVNDTVFIVAALAKMGLVSIAWPE
ncbi:MAG: hypothetical protein AVDCRST_MAG39-1391 [uncultured Sphingomonadaceae bacterium]|uniref:Glycosyl transferase family 1 domain-containing protein n=1 Tax=uncultured Sphingomonadaceae bacterium TaxID=169976 RepID=A0A6J4SK36_9SPHN|nr:MAG: hypothetical protein AVDCRST_MAG39-1391 [uncultured Sphingomonadaceae bacterium]